MNKTLVMALLATLALPFAAHAEHSEGLCDSGDAPALGIIEFEAPDGTIYYIDDRNYLLGNGIWLYEETNGVYDEDPEIGHLQRGGASDVVPDDAEVCTDVGDWGPDRLIL